MNQDNKAKAAVIVSAIIGKVQLIIGIAITLLFGLMIIGLLTDGEFRSSMGVGGAIFIFLFFALGIWLILLGKKRSKLIKTFKSYVSRLSTDPTGSIDQLASSSSTSVDIVNKNLNEMIKKKYFVNAFIDKDRNCIIFPHYSQSQTQTQTQGTLNRTQTQNQAIEFATVSCKGCGATNKVAKGSVGECDFCGSQIK